MPALSDTLIKLISLTVLTASSSSSMTRMTSCKANVPCLLFNEDQPLPSLGPSLRSSSLAAFGPGFVGRMARWACAPVHLASEAQRRCPARMPWRRARAPAMGDICSIYMASYCSGRYVPDIQSTFNEAEDLNVSGTGRRRARPRCTRQCNVVT